MSEQTTESKSYEVTTLDDILSIPSDRLDVFFAELIPHIKRYSVMKEAIDQIGSILDPDDEKPSEAVKLMQMIWTDDGKESVTTNLTIETK